MDDVALVLKIAMDSSRAEKTRIGLLSKQR